MEPELTEKDKKILDLARQTLTMSRNTLLVNLRFLDMALSMLEFFPNDEAKLATDGKYLLYQPIHVLKRYRDEREAIVRDYLHMIMHCVFRHMYVHTLLDHHCWDLACDIAVEYAIYGLGLKCTSVRREILMKQTFDELEKQGIMMTAEKLYRYFLDQNLPEAKLAELRGAFYSDGHRIWYMTDDEKEDAYGIPNPAGSSTGSGKGGEGESSGATGEITESILMRTSADGMRLTEQEWKNISESIQMDMETFSNGRGGVSQGLIQNLKEVNREKYDYTAFLKKFATMGEVMKVNDDEFDYIFYTYGLKLYKKVPLIEPLEYKETKRIKEFVLAIDTSGSVVGDLVQRFVQKTYNVMKSTESFFSKINLHIIQCDDQIQEDVKITSQEEFDRYFATMQLKGFGGNNEIGLFSYVDELIAKKEFTNLKGMIYFTDGYGIFPRKKPDYEVAFVFIENARWDIPDDIPPWVIKLVLSEDDI